MTDKDKEFYEIFDISEKGQRMVEEQCERLAALRKKWVAEAQAEEEERAREQQEYLKKHGLSPEDFRKTYDHPNTMENSTATILWLVSMGVSALFVGGIILWIPETILWWKFITRHKK